MWLHINTKRTPTLLQQRLNVLATHCIKAAEAPPPAPFTAQGPMSWWHGRVLCICTQCVRERTHSAHTHTPLQQRLPALVAMHNGCTTPTHSLPLPHFKIHCCGGVDESSVFTLWVSDCEHEHTPALIQQKLTVLSTMHHGCNSAAPPQPPLCCSRSSRTAAATVRVEC